MAGRSRSGRVAPSNGALMTLGKLAQRNSSSHAVSGPKGLTLAKPSLRPFSRRRPPTVTRPAPRQPARRTQPGQQQARARGFRHCRHGQAAVDMQARRVPHQPTGQGRLREVQARKSALAAAPVEEVKALAGLGRKAVPVGCRGPSRDAAARNSTVTSRAVRLCRAKLRTPSNMWQGAKTANGGWPAPAARMKASGQRALFFGWQERPFADPHP